MNVDTPLRIAILLTVLCLLTIHASHVPFEEVESLIRQYVENASKSLSSASQEPRKLRNIRREAIYGEYRFAAVADDSGICGKLGTDVMARQGGSVVDAMVTTMLCTGLANPHSTGLAGGLMMTVFATPRGQTEKEMMTIISRERAPLAAHRDMFENSTDEELFQTGLSFGVPGQVKGLYDAWLRYGRLPWKTLLQPIIDMCYNGIRVNRMVTHAIDVKPTLLDNPEISKIFFKADGSKLYEGELMYRPRLGKTMELLAEDPLSFYDPQTELGRSFLEDMKDYGAIITGEDLLAYESYIKAPLKIRLNHGDYNVYAPPPPSSGAVLLHLLSILDGYNFTAENIANTGDKLLTYHRIVEAFKFAYAKRSALGDENFVDVLAQLTSQEYAASRRQLINDDHTLSLAEYEPAFELTEESGTVHLSFLAADGSAVSVTSSINQYFGAALAGARTGIIFNNVMDDFSLPGKANNFGLPPSPSNFITPGKMPQTSMCPFILTDSNGVVRFISGAAGASSIISASALVTAHALWLGTDLKEAVGMYRFHHQLVPNCVDFEHGVERGWDEAEEIISGLEAKGHEICFGSFTVVQAIQNKCAADNLVRSAPCILAASDGRKCGVPDGL